MYRQVKITPDQTDYQRIVWRSSETAPIEDYRITRVTFGMDCSAYLAIRTLRRTAEDGALKYPIGSEAVLNEFYVDNLMSGADTLEHALTKQSQIVDLLDQGGFNLRKWISNDPEALQNTPQDKCEMQPLKTIQFDTPIKTLGLYWNPKTDNLGFQIKFEPITDSPTKRSILSDISKLYDPFGWISPVTITGKILIQTLWLAGLDWDQRVPKNIEDQWLNYIKNINEIERIKIPRWLGLKGNSNKTELHVFSDSSNQAYAAVLYLRVETEHTCFSRLLAAKTRVAPLKPISLPRLELCGALLASKLTFQAITDLKWKKVDVYAWTDSKIVLAWLKGQPRRWKTFVANRIGEIHEKLKNAQWRHVPSSQNPADLPTRGIPPDKIADLEFWWNGPPWLIKPPDSWPQSPVGEDTMLEERHAHTTTVVPEFDLLHKFSTLTKLIRVTALCLRFAQNCKVDKHNRNTGIISTHELNQALTSLIKIVQSQEFGQEIKTLLE